MTSVTVQIEWPPELEALPEAARARVTVEDVSFADASSTVVGETVLTHLATDRPAVAVVEVGEVDPRADLSVRVHIFSGDRDRADREPVDREPAAGDGADRGPARVEVGDLVTTQSYPVLTYGYGDTVVVTPRVVRP